MLPFHLLSKLFGSNEAATSQEIPVEAQAPSAPMGLPPQPESLQGLDPRGTEGAVGPEVPVDLSQNIEPAAIPGAANEPSLFDRISQRIDAKEAAGDVGLSPSGKGGRNPSGDPLEKAISDSVKTSAAKQDYEDHELKAAHAQANKDKSLALLLKGANLMTAGAVKAKPTAGVGDDQMKMAEDAPKQILEQRKARMDMLKFADEKEKSDPNSPVSKIAQQTIQMMGQRLGKNFQVDGMSASSLEKVFGPIEKYMAAVESAEARKEAAKSTQAQREESLRLRQEAAEKKEQDTLDKNVGKVSDKLQKHGVVSATQSLQEIDKLLEGGLDNTKGDVPGFGMFDGLRPGFATGDKGNQLRQAVQRLANVELKNRSGTAVSDTEYKRFKEEFGNGTWKTEEQLLNGLRQYRNVLKRVTQELEAGSPQDALSEYGSRAGSVRSTDIPDKRTSKEGSSSNMNSSQDAAINAFMKGNGIKDRNEAIRILKENGRL